MKAKDIIKGSAEKVCAAFIFENHLYKFYYAGLLDSIDEAAGRGLR
ncbi:MAG: hypothetical protein QXS10_03265 [Candidatus Bathyarchaeia archaeon]